MSPQSFFLHSGVRLMFDLPLCNARLFEDGLSIHTSKVRNHIAANQVQPLCRIDHISWPSLQASSCFPDISLPTSFQFLLFSGCLLHRKKTAGQWRRKRTAAAAVRGDVRRDGGPQDRRAHLAHLRVRGSVKIK